MAAAHRTERQLIDDLLTLARSGDEVTETASLDLGAVVDGAGRTFRRTARHLWSVEQTVVADRDRLDQLLENLFRTPSNTVPSRGDAGRRRRRRERPDRDRRCA
ncbi:hypothetical protein C8039_11630 [Halogeometricum sp. wsp3]|nr:hypothetical protein C8039_11630 [Halogeometricum sp. wsp3]